MFSRGIAMALQTLNIGVNTTISHMNSRMNGIGGLDFTQVVKVFYDNMDKKIAAAKVKEHSLSGFSTR